MATTATERTYANLVYAGRRTYASVPDNYKAGVLEYLQEHYKVTVDEDGKLVPVS